MINSKNSRFCGPPGVTLTQFLGIKTEDNVTSWFQDTRSRYVHTARTAIRHLREVLRLPLGSEILAPAYNCGSEIDPLIKSGLTVILYHIDRNCRVDIVDLNARISNNTRAIYVTHYFGFPQPIDAIKDICEKNEIFLIEDCALSLFSSDGTKHLGKSGDISIFSFPKTLPVPDGGLLVMNNPNLMAENLVLDSPNRLLVMRGILPLIKSKVLNDLSRTKGLNHLYKLLFYIVQKKRLPSVQVSSSQSCEKPDMLLDMYCNETLQYKKMSAISKKMLNTFIVGDIIKKRRANFNYFLNYFSGYRDDVIPLFKKLPDGVCPLQFPIIVKDRDYLKKILNEKGINVIAWWKGYIRNLQWHEFVDACFLKDNVLTLPVHQDLDIENISYIAEELLKAIRQK